MFVRFSYGFSSCSVFNRITSVTGLVYDCFDPFFAVVTSTFRTLPSALLMAFEMRASGQSFLGDSLHRRRTRSPSLRFGWAVCHFLLLCRVGRNSFFHRDQKRFARNCTWRHCFVNRSWGTKFPGVRLSDKVFCVRRVDGVRISGAEGSLEMATSGRLFTMAVTSAISVDRTSWVNRVGRRSANIESRIRLEIPIIRSHTPPVCEACGELKTHLHPRELRYVSNVS